MRLFLGTVTGTETDTEMDTEMGPGRARKGP